jgi:hypothetical protein
MSSTRERRRPRRFSPAELAKFGVTVVPNPADDFRPILECDQCGVRWLPCRRTGGYWAHLYWACPRFGCNRRVD